MRRFVRHLTVGLLALGTLAMLTAQADAQLRCLSPAERAAFDLQALRSELMVLATGCGDDQPYNAFIERYKPELMMNEHAISSYFREKFGRRGQQEHDHFVTDLANAQASIAGRLGSEFCPRNGQIFHEAMALRSVDELRPFAAGQALLPPSLDICPVEVAQAPERKPTQHARPRHR
jgi:hypothetical protein